LKKRIAGVLVACLLIGSVPGRAEDGNAASKPAAEERARGLRFRDSVDRAVDRAAQGGSALPVPVPLTLQERTDLDARRAALRTDPVARGTGGIVLGLLGAALSVGLTVYLVNKSKNETTTTPTAGMARR
jgi:hypothetical protein